MRIENKNTCICATLVVSTSLIAASGTLLFFLQFPTTATALLAGGGSALIITLAIGCVCTRLTHHKSFNTLIPKSDDCTPCTLAEIGGLMNESKKPQDLSPFRPPIFGETIEGVPFEVFFSCSIDPLKKREQMQQLHPLLVPEINSNIYLTKTDIYIKYSDSIDLESLGRQFFAIFQQITYHFFPKYLQYNQNYLESIESKKITQLPSFNEQTTLKEFFRYVFCEAHFSSLCLGALHVVHYEYLINLLSFLRDLGVTEIILENVCYDLSQTELDQFHKTGVMSPNIDDVLKALDNHVISLLVNFNKKKSTIQSPDPLKQLFKEIQASQFGNVFSKISEEKQPLYGYYGLVVAAQKHGIRIIAGDSMSSHIDPHRVNPRSATEINEMHRYLNANAEMHRIYQHTRLQNPSGKILLIMGAGHAYSGSAYLDLGPKGMAQLIGCPFVYVQYATTLSSSPSLFNQKSYQILERTFDHIDAIFSVCASN